MKFKRVFIIEAEYNDNMDIEDMEDDMENAVREGLNNHSSCFDYHIGMRD